MTEPEARAMVGVVMGSDSDLPTMRAAVDALAAELLERQRATPRTTHVEAASRAERKVRLQEALNLMGPLDREVLALRHFEQLSNAEAAQVLGVKDPAASKCYVRAVKHLKDILVRLPGGRDDEGGA